MARSIVSYSITTVVTGLLVIFSLACNQPSKETSFEISSQSQPDKTNQPKYAPQATEGMEITFKLAPPVKQQSIYVMKYLLDIENKSADSSDREQETENAKVETEMRSQASDGNWTLLGKITIINTKQDQHSNNEANASFLGSSFSIRMDSQGRILDIPEAENEGSFALQREVLIYMNPTFMLPTNPVKVGGSWSIEALHSLQKSENKVAYQTLKGTGTLKAVDKGQAVIDLDFTSDVTDEVAGSKRLLWISRGKSSVTYDLEKAQFTTNKTEITRETIGFAFSDNDKHIKTIFKESLQLDLVNK